MYSKAFKDVSNALKLAHVWTYQAYHGIAAKYKRTILGSLWISGSMVATSLSMAIVFGGIFGQNLQDAFPRIMAGIICYNLVSYPLSEGPEIFMANSPIIRNHAYPFSYFVFEGVFKNLLTNLHNLIVFYFAMALVGAIVVPHWFIIIGIMLVFITIVSWGTIAGMLAARFRDLRFALPWISGLLFVLTPVFWQASMLKGWRAKIVEYNPMWGLLEVLRDPLMGQMPPRHAILLAVIAAVSGVIAWFLFFPANRRKIPFWI